MISQLTTKLSSKTRTVGGVILTLTVMATLAINAPAIYNTFCRITGWGGTTQVASAPSTEVLDRKVTIRFDASTAKGMPWTFTPEEISREVYIGETGLAFYVATNTTDEPIIGTASYNVQPAKVGEHFYKVECFCFQEQLLMPGESMRMPVTFYVNPEMADNPRLDDVRDITLSYTFYRNRNAEARMAETLSASVETPPDDADDA